MQYGRSFCLLRSFLLGYCFSEATQAVAAVLASRQFSLLDCYRANLHSWTHIHRLNSFSSISSSLPHTRAFPLAHRCRSSLQGSSMAFPGESRLYTYTVYHGIAWYGMAVLAVMLLILCSLLAGLTLALGGLDRTSLQLRSVTGTSRQQFEPSLPLM
jgi:hypothetical protein